MNVLGIESSSKKLSVGLMKGKKFTELHSEKINDTANSLPLLSKKVIKDNVKIDEELDNSVDQDFDEESQLADDSKLEEASNKISELEAAVQYIQATDD